MKKEIQRDEFLRKRMERQRKIRKRRLTAFFIIFIIMLLCIGAVLSFTVFFPIQNINVKGSEIYSQEEILTASGIKKGDNLFAVSKDKTQNILKKKLPFVESVDFERSLPDSLKITVKDAVEFASYSVKGNYYKVSSSGWVLEKSTEKPENLLNIICNVKCAVGNQIIYNDSAEKEILDNITAAFKEKNIKVNIIDISNQVAIELRVEDRFDVNLGTANNITEKINHLEGMIKSIKPESKGKINLSMWTNDNTKGHFTAENE